ncbi:hypothetical protein HHI36_004851 [Cryptolaemus montrouzieri]|uniref:Uncharacterized protein n=1 Tax=Cryptolaemus montrouzieri TaxID=559131 RepID=A0ABD2NTZ1_9CUCU
MSGSETCYLLELFVTSFCRMGIDFLENTHGKSDAITEARRYTDNIDDLIKMMYDIYPHLTDRALKSRITRLNKKLKEQSETENSDDNESVYSNQSESQKGNSSQKPK